MNSLGLGAETQSTGQ